MTDLMKSQTDPPYPSDSYLNYLRNGDVMAKIGATVTFEQCNGGIARGFESSAAWRMVDFCHYIRLNFLAV